MIVADSKKLLYVHIYKTGGSSITDLLAPYITEEFRSKKVKTSGPRWQDSWHFDRIQHSKFSEALPKLDRYNINLDEYFKFVFVRNPYSWVLSIWNNFYQSPHRNSTINFKNFLKLNARKLLNKKLDSQHFYEMYSDNSFKSFILFIDEIISKDMPIAKTAWGAADQYSFVENDRNIKFDFVGRFENLLEDSNKIFNTLGIQKLDEMPHRICSKNKQKRQNYLEYYDEESIKIVNKLFIRDFENFGYQLIKP